MPPVQTESMSHGNYEFQGQQLQPQMSIYPNERYFEEEIIDENDVISLCLLGSVSVPTVLRNRQCLRSGKWTKEEEHFAFTIIQHFQTGTLGIPETATLRQCLSVALNCDAMRISKKFAGPYSIGKQVFSPIDRNTPNYAMLTSMCVEELNIARSNWFSKLDELEASNLSRTRKRIRPDTRTETEESKTGVIRHQTDSADLEAFHSAVMGLNSLKQQTNRVHGDPSGLMALQYPQQLGAGRIPNALQMDYDKLVPRVLYSMGKILKGDYIINLVPQYPMMMMPPAIVPQGPMYMMPGVPPQGISPQGSMQPWPMMMQTQGPDFGGGVGEIPISYSQH